MRRLIDPAKPCIERFRDRMPSPYFASIVLKPTPARLLILQFQSGEETAFNACVVDAVQAAHLPAGTLTSPVAVPFAFSFAESVSQFTVDADGRAPVAVSSER
jgi:hypothetical protein